jgi:centromeric protein E
VSGLKEEVVVSAEHVMSILATGEAHRHVGATDFNEKSSRSHTIFRMVVESKQISDVINNSSAVRVSHLVS